VGIARAGEWDLDLLHATGQIKSAFLDEEAQFGEIWLGPRTPHPTDPEGQRSVTSTYEDLFFYANGQLRSGVLSRAQRIRDFELQATYSVYFFENGLLAGGTLLGDQSIAGIKCLGHFAMYENGAPSAVYLAADQCIMGLPYQAGTRLFFDTNGKVKGTAGGSLLDWMRLESPMGSEWGR
jgi:hypothetical protein